MSGNWVVFDGRLRASASNCRLVPRFIDASRFFLCARSVSVLATYHEGMLPLVVPFLLLPALLAGGRHRSGTRVPGEPHALCAVSVLEFPLDISDAERKRGGGPLRPPIVHSKPCRSMRTTVVPVASTRPSRSSVWRGADVEEECYLVDPASSHMLVSKIKPCMCKYEQIQTVKLRMAH